MRLHSGTVINARLGFRVAHTANLVCRATPRASPGGDGEALRQAADIYRQAQQLSHLATQYELQQAFLADDLNDPEPLHDLRAVSAASLMAYFEEQGLSHTSAERLVRDMQSKGMQVYNLARLTAQLERWRRVLGDMDVVQLLQRDVALLEQDVNLAIMNLIQLVDTFPGRDIFGVLQRQPRLLWCSDLPDRKERVLKQLVRLHPSNSREVVAAIVAENPELLYRMDYYPDITLIDELPMEIQNMFIIADQGLGAMHRYWQRQKAQTLGQGQVFSSESETDEYGF